MDEKQAEAFLRELRRERNPFDLAVQLFGPDSPEAEAAMRELVERLAKAFSVLHPDADVQEVFALVQEWIGRRGRH
jgi:hypothetical protein